jgi:hypothetical protein
VHKSRTIHVGMIRLDHHVSGWIEIDKRRGSGVWLGKPDHSGDIIDDA